ncbi:hypothetical protein AURDEDRAFT_171654 [Auricularia subglabra TFB-10046 SS5]|nr:hypothetical protein AURDEDRAFT_171654 [Auricularia subglabra TFB-10046 SS5]
MALAMPKDMDPPTGCTDGKSAEPKFPFIACTLLPVGQIGPCIDVVLAAATPACRDCLLNNV